MGPESLRCALGTLLNVFKQSIIPPEEKGFLTPFVDDFMFKYTDGTSIPALIHLLRRCGFAVSRSKFQDQSPFNVFNQNFAIQSSDPSVTLQCNQKMELADCISQMRIKSTKRVAFKLGGILSYDPAGLHAERRLAGDILRSIAGKAPSWDSHLDRKATSQVNEVLSWVQDLGCEACSHVFIPNREFSIYSDASLAGWAYVIKMGSVTITARAGKWSQTEASYHPNRMEGLALFYSLRFFARFLEFREDVAVGTHRAFLRDIIVRIFSDSKTAVAWANGRLPTGASHSLEYRMLTRLQSGLHREVITLKQLCNEVTVDHLAGSKNEEADRLSRVLIEKGIHKTLKEEVEGRVARIISLEKISLVEKFANDSTDFPHFLSKFEPVCALMRAWSKSA